MSTSVTHRIRRPPAGRYGGRTVLGCLLVALPLAVAACSSGTSSPPPTTRHPSSAASPSGPSTTTSAAVPPASGLPPVRHVFVIVLENEDYAGTFGSPADDPYLATTLPSEGALLTHYFGIGHFSNDNYIALISGQAPNPDTQGDCLDYVDFPAGATVDASGQITGSGCVYPSTVQTLPNQLEAAGFTWKAYMEDMGNIAGRESAVCGHPALGTPDGTEKAVPGDGYATRHDPFVYFHSIIDDTSSCDTRVVPLGSPTGAVPSSAPAGTTGLATDLRSIATTPNVSFITPNLCDDGHDAPCINQAGSASPAVNVDAFLSTWVPMITNSPAFRADGLLIVTFDEADATGPTVDASACCNEQPGPASPLPGGSGPGGGRIGAVLLSPYIAPGTVSDVPYNHYSTLASIERLFGLARLGQAATTTSSFGSDVFTRPGASRSGGTG